MWISGKNMGEAARLWLLLQPWVVVAAAGALSDQCASAPKTPPARNAIWLALLAVQAIACIATVTRVDGFDLQMP